jgi:DNA-binding transcriptional regulator YiaG
MRITDMDRKPEIYTALGFPVVIVNPKYRLFEGEEVLDISPKDIMEGVFRLIPDKRGRLTGSEIRFLRSYMKLTQEAFGKMIGVDHSSIAKWEAKKAEITGMEIQVEILLRARCRLFGNKKAHIGENFIENLLTDLARKDSGEPLQLAI